MIVKDTLTPLLMNLPSKAIEEFSLGIERSLEAARSSVIPNVPVISGRLKNSIQGTGISSSKATSNKSARRTKRLGTYNGKDDNILGVEVKSNAVIGTLGTKVPYAAKVEYRKHYFAHGFNNARSIVDAILRTSLQKIFR